MISDSDSKRISAIAELVGRVEELEAGAKLAISAISGDGFVAPELLLETPAQVTSAIGALLDRVRRIEARLDKADDARLVARVHCLEAERREGGGP
jgi:hypothetical protein